MLERRDPEPAFFAPFVSSPMRVDPAWIDYNGHLNMAYYNVLFDRAVDEVYELLAGDLVRVTFQLLDFDLKRLHYFEELHHAEQGWLSATSENMALHVDVAAKKTVPFPDTVAKRLAQMKAAHAGLPLPDGAGRRIAMPGK